MRSASTATGRPPGDRDRDRGKRREILTPEGIPLGMTLADAGDRAGAFLLDMLIIYGTSIAVGVLTWLAAGRGDGSTWVMPFILLLLFLLQNFYFIYFELRWQGVTPGKRVVGTRVIDAHGGALGADAVIARNLMRDIEVFVPLQVLLGAEALWPGASGWGRLLACLWALILMLLPLLNRDRRRPGDLVAGTLVVLDPKALLLPDISGQATPAAGAAAAGQPACSFTSQELGVYGIYELQVLEDLLRRSPDSPGHDHTMATVAAQIQTKIGWQQPAGTAVDAERFLRGFYTALRAHLEHEMSFGKRREDKHSRA